MTDLHVHDSYVSVNLMAFIGISILLGLLLLAMGSACFYSRRPAKKKSENEAD